jgi:hypothetical protein
MSRQTNAARRSTHAQTARQKAAAARAATQRRERHRRLWLLVGSTVAVLAVIGVIVTVGVTSSGSKKPAAGRPSASVSVVDAVTGVPAATLNSVGPGTLTTAPKPVNDASLTASGKPEVLFIGAEYCPYCAAERWAVVQALSRFGTFTGLKSIHSSPTDVYPNTATFSFYGASYTSPAITFIGREVETVSGSALQTPTQAEAALWHRYTGNQGSFPFLDIAGRYIVTGPSFDPGVLKGLTAQQIAAALTAPASPVAKAIDGTANMLTAAICTTTNEQPASVCSAGGVTAAAKALHG